MRNIMVVVLFVMAACVCLAAGDESVRSKDAYITQSGTTWTLGTSKMERIVALRDGKLVTQSLKSKASGHEFVVERSGAGVFSLASGEGVDRIASANGQWSFVDAKRKRLKQGELQLDITVQQEAIVATKTYVVYPGSSIVREWVTIRNGGDKPILAIEPSFLDLNLKPSGDDPQLDLHWMTGGESRPGSWVLRTEPLTAGKPRKFDSYDPFPPEPGTAEHPGDGINAKILLNEGQVWPASGWQYVANADVNEPIDLEVDVKAGDEVAFLVNMNENIAFDTTAFDPTIAYDDGEKHTASAEFSEEQGRSGWRYRYLENGEYVDLVYYAQPRQWRKKVDNATGTPFVGVSDQHPDAGQDAARVWTATKSGHVRITAVVCNTGNRSSGGGYGFRMGTTSYAPWSALYDEGSGDGVFICWDYMGHWASSYARNADDSVNVQLRVAGHKQTLAPGESLTTPKAFTGLYRDDLDNAGNECLDWQYTYLWDYTREPWFPAIRMLGYWMRGTGWGKAAWTGGKPDYESTFRKVFRVTDLMRYVGADVYHRDWGWWDVAGDWNGPDFRTTIEYLGKHDMGQLIYAFLYTVAGDSKVAKEHPDWVLNGTLDMSKPEVVAFMKGQLDDFVARWGNFEWRNDSCPTSPNGADDTPLLGQDIGLRKVIQDFLDKYPKCAFQAVNGGGNDAGIDYARYASTVSFSDGGVGVLRNYWASLILPPDKTSDIPDIWNPNAYDKAIWRGLLCINFDMTGDTWDPAKLEGLRELIGIYHYLHKQGVVGRWVRVYRPLITGDDPTMYFQRMSGDGKRGIIIPKQTAPRPVGIKPKGLLPEERYVVSFHESPDSETRTGSDLMTNGITIEKMPAGELIYLNLPLHPGSKLDMTPPTAPVSITKKRGENMGYPGVEIRWKPGRDDNWVSYYEVFRDGVAIDKVAHGAFYFDHSAGADPAAVYELRTVDGSGNVSKKVTASGGAGRRVTVIDDAPGSAIAYTGDWQRQTGLQPAYLGTISSADQKDAAIEISFEGQSVLWFSKLGPDCGKAAVSVDGGPAEIVDTYSGDDIWGVCVWRKALAAPGKHTLRIVVLGDHSENSSGNLVHLDGVQAQP